MIDSFRRGEDISVGLNAISGDMNLVDTVAAYISKSRSRSEWKKDTNFGPIQMQTATRDPVGETPGGWTFTLSAIQSANLEPGLYGIDAVKDYTGGGRDITDSTYLFRITESAAT